MLTRFIKIQLVLFTILTIIAITVLGWYYLRIPSIAGIGQYDLHADLPRSGGLYATANVTYRGTQIGKVTEVKPTENGAQRDDEHRQPLQDPGQMRRRMCTRCRRSVSSTWTWCRRETPVSTSALVRRSRKAPSPVRSGPRWTPPTTVWPCCPRRRSTRCSPKPRNAVGGLGPALQRLVDSTTNVAQGFKDNLPQVNDIIANSAPILDSQVQSGDNIEQWSRNLDIIASQTAEQDAALRSGLEQAAPTLDQLNTVFSGVRDALPQTLANLAIVIDMLKRYNKGLEQALVILPQGAAVAPGGNAVRGPRPAAVRRCRSTSRRRA